MQRTDRWFQLLGSTLALCGELAYVEIDGFNAAVASINPLLPQQFALDLSDFEVVDGAAVVAAVNAIRTLASGRTVVVVGAPQVLAHNLYRVGDLLSASLSLQATREDEPYG